MDSIRIVLWTAQHTDTYFARNMNRTESMMEHLKEISECDVSECSPYMQKIERQTKNDRKIGESCHTTSEQKQRRSFRESCETIYVGYGEATLNTMPFRHENKKPKCFISPKCGMWSDRTAHIESKSACLHGMLLILLRVFLAAALLIKILETQIYTYMADMHWSPSTSTQTRKHEHDVYIVCHMFASRSVPHMVQT